VAVVGVVIVVEGERRREEKRREEKRREEREEGALNTSQQRRASALFQPPGEGGTAISTEQGCRDGVPSRCVLLCTGAGWATLVFCSTVCDAFPIWSPYGGLVTAHSAAPLTGPPRSYGRRHSSGFQRIRRSESHRWAHHTASLAAPPPAPPPATSHRQEVPVQPQAVPGLLKRTSHGLKTATQRELSIRSACERQQKILCAQVRLADERV